MSWSAPKTYTAATAATAADRNTYERDNMNEAAGVSGTATRTAGNITMNGTTWATVTTDLDLTLAAAANNRLLSYLYASTDAAAVDLYLDTVWVTSGTQVFGHSGTTGEGNPGWTAESGRVEKISGPNAPYTAVSGDISGANIQGRIRGRTASASARVVEANADAKLRHVLWRDAPSAV